MAPNSPWIHIVPGTKPQARQSKPAAKAGKHIEVTLLMTFGQNVAAQISQTFAGKTLKEKDNENIL